MKEKHDQSKIKKNQIRSITGKDQQIYINADDMIRFFETLGSDVLLPHDKGGPAVPSMIKMAIYSAMLTIAQKVKELKRIKNLQIASRN